ncbi:MAG TPA: hypothetical protein V6C97_19265 [Oculatellaceae cyanobacterium]
MFKIAGKSSEKSVMTKPLVVKQGQVKQMTLPPGWREIKPFNNRTTDYSREFAPPERDDVKIVFFYRGHRVHRKAGEQFLEVLSLPEHELSQDERVSVEWIIRNASEPDWFAIKSLRTEHVNRKVALVMEGLWLQNRMANLGLFFDADGTGTSIQEIHYTSPESDYFAFLPDAVSAIKSIVWK